MDDNYDFEAARLQLGIFSKERASLWPNLQLSSFSIDGGLNSSVVQHLPDEEIKWRLTKPSDGTDELEEVVFQIQGVLCEKELPPLRIGNRMSTQAKYLKRSVTLAGLNEEFFSKCIQSIIAIDSMFSKNFNIDETQPWKKQTYLDYDAVTFSNRYFTDVSRRSFMPAVPFTQAEDPTGNLSLFNRERGLRHCEENIVKYFVLQKGGGTAKASPTIFSSGDLVEALVSFVMIPVGRQYTLKPILRGLVMLDNTERGRASTKRNADNIHLTPSPARYKLKRKYCYDSYQDSVQEEGTLRGLSRLRVDKDDDVSMDKNT